MNTSTAKTKSKAPYSEQSELCMLSGCLRDRRWLEEATSLLTPDDLLGEPARPLFQAILEADNVDNFAALADRAAEISRGLSSEDFQDLITRCVTNRFYHSKDIRGTITRIRDTAARRRILEYLREDAESDLMATDCELNEAAGRVVARIDSLAPGMFEARVHNAADLMSNIFDILEKRATDGQSPSTGIYDLDDPKAINGFQGSRFIVVAGRPSTGKTRLARFFILSLIKQGVKVRFYSLEESKEALQMKMMAVEAGIPANNLKRPTDRDFEALFGVDGVMSKDFWQNLTITDSMSGQDILRDIPRFAAQNPGAVVFVDYLQNMPGKIDKNSSLTQELGAISKLLARYSVIFGVEIIALSQLSRASESRIDKRPELSDLKQSGDIEQAAVIVMMLYRDEVNNPNTTERGVMEIILRKNRDGEQNVVIKVLIDSDLQTIRNRTRPRYDNDY